MHHSISHRIAYSWIAYISRGLLALALAAVLAATPPATPPGPPASNENQSIHNGDHEVTPFVNWNS